MAIINISDIRPVGSDLFCDVEKYMDDLNDNELNRVIGGTDPVTGIIVGFALAYIADQLF